MLIALKELSVQGAEALSSAFVVGYPGLTRINGTIHAIRRKILAHTRGRVSLNISGFMVLHHGGQVRLHGKYRDRLTQKRSVYNGSLVPSKDRSDLYFTPPMVSRPQLDLTVSIILDCDSRGADDLREAVHGDPELLSIVTQPNGLGGRVSGCAGIVFQSSMADMLRRLKSGRFLADRTAQLEQKDRDPLDVLLDTLEDRRPGVNPIHIGYRLLEHPTERVTARSLDQKPTPHAFAEPIIGMSEFVKKSAVLTEEGRLETIYFKSRLDKANRLCVVQGEQVPEDLLPRSTESIQTETDDQ